MITIYRIEHKKEKYLNGIGYGPYIIASIDIKGAWHDLMCGAHLHDTHPGMRDDMHNYYDISNRSNFYCGFQSIEELKCWFRGFLTDMKKNGFVIKKYLVKEATESISGLQTFFDYTKVIASEIY